MQNNTCMKFSCHSTSRSNSRSVAGTRFISSKGTKACFFVHRPKLGKLVHSFPVLSLYSFINSRIAFSGTVKGVIFHSPSSPTRPERENRTNCFFSLWPYIKVKKKMYKFRHFKLFRVKSHLTIKIPIPGILNPMGFSQKSLGSHSRRIPKNPGDLGFLGNGIPKKSHPKATSRPGRQFRRTFGGSQSATKIHGENLL